LVFFIHDLDTLTISTPVRRCAESCSACGA
jgi:hypothetical protein